MKQESKPLEYIVVKGQIEIFRTKDIEWAKGVAMGYNHYYCNPSKPHIYKVKPIYNRQHETNH